MDRFDTTTESKRPTQTDLESGRKGGPVDENTRLFDIRSLASATKQRITAQASSQQDAEEALLASTAHSSLHAIPVVEANDEMAAGSAAYMFQSPWDQPVETPPEPAVTARGTRSDVEGQEVTYAPAIARAEAAEAKPVAAAAPVTMSPAVASPAISAMPMDRPTPAWVFAAIGLAAVVAIGAFVMFGGSGDEGDDVASAAQAVAIDDSEEPTAEPIAEPVVEEAAAEAAVAEPAVEEEAVEEEAVEEEVPAADEATADEEPAKEEKKRRYKRDRKVAPKQSDGKLSDALADRKLTEKKAPIKVVDKSSNPKANINQLLDQAAVGTAFPDAKVEKKDKKPSKTEITRGDVKTAMGKVSGRAKACYDLYEKAGTVQIRFTVSPDGKVTKAAPTGSFKGTDTGHCVAKAVKKAKFPAFAGAPSSFTYPFLLSP